MVITIKYQNDNTEYYKKSIDEIYNYEMVIYMRFYYDDLTSLPKLPNQLKILHCSHNKLTSLSRLPDSLEILFCNNNQLTELPSLPNSLE